jgi:hypothetical protein
MGGAGAQAYCLECAGIYEPSSTNSAAQTRTWLAFLAQLLR